MPIPYTVQRLIPGFVKIRSEFIKYADFSESTLVKFISKSDGVEEARVNKNTGSVYIYYKEGLFNLEQFFSLLNNASPALVQQLLAGIENGNNNGAELPNGNGAKKWFITSTMGLFPFLFRSTLPGSFLTGLTFLLSLPIFRKALSSIRKKSIDVHILDSSALALSAFKGSSLASMLMVWLLSLGDLIEEQTQGRAKKEIAKLLNYDDEMVWLVIDENETSHVPIDDINKGERIVVYTGEKIPIDGMVYQGEALVNQASLTGESNPVLKAKNDNVFAGTFIEDGKLYIEVEKIGDETALAKIVQIIEESINQPIETQKKAEEMANRYVIPTILTSGGIYGLTSNLQRTISTLTFDYHTGIHVSTPTSIMSHMTLAARRGILFKSGRHLEIMHNVDTVVFDKTGTLTIGHPQITDVVEFGISEERSLQLAASLEQRITHPVAKSIVQRAKDSNIKLLPRKESVYHRGLGIQAKLNGSTYLIGSTKFMEKMRISIDKKVQENIDSMHENGESVLYLVQDKKIVSLIGFSDPLREESREVVERLYKLGREVILCTGDNEGAAQVVAKKLGIERYHSRAFPDEKAKIINKLKGQGRTVAFLGDGVNDSPALSVADIGISIYSGADIAIEVADVVINNDLKYLIEAIKISDMTLNNIEENYFINKMANSVGMVGAVAGIVSPVFATMVNNGITVLIGLNALKPIWSSKYYN